MGTTAILHPSIGRPLRIAHLTDLHVLPDDLRRYPEPFADWIQGQRAELDNPNAAIATVCDRIAAAKVDLVLIGGDIVNFLDDQAVGTAMKLLARTGARLCCCMGNHERPWSVPLDAPAIPGMGKSDRRSIQLSEQPISDFAPRLGMRANPYTERFDYSVIHNQVRIVVLDSSFGEFTTEQAEWMETEVRDELPFLILTHVPFPVLTLVPRIRIIARDQMLGHILDNSACHRVMSLTNRPGFLGSLAGHLHVRSEDLLGNACQLLTQPAAYGGYRIIDLLPICTTKIFPASSRHLMQRPKAARLMKLS